MTPGGPFAARVAGTAIALVLMLALAVGCAGQEPEEGAVAEAPETQVGDSGADASQVSQTGSEEAAARADEVQAGSEPDHATARRLRVEVVETYPHSPDAFTQGLFLEGPGSLVESIGQYGLSELRRVDLASGEVMRRRQLANEIFAEGLARVPSAAMGLESGQDRLFQISWREGLALVWDATTFERVGEHSYPGEGWGLCWMPNRGGGSGGRLVMSDGSDRLTFRDPRTFEVVGEVQVTSDGQPQPYLNELECVDGHVWANLYGPPILVEIDPADGEVQSRVDASGLLTAEEGRRVDVLNGIAYDPADGTFLITGKLWPKLFRVRFVPMADTD